MATVTAAPAVNRMTVKYASEATAVKIGTKTARKLARVVAVVLVVVLAAAVAAVKIVPVASVVVSTPYTLHNAANCYSLV